MTMLPGSSPVRSSEAQLAPSGHDLTMRIAERIANLPRKSKADWHAIEHLDLLVFGAEFFPKLIAEINAAQQSVWLETYIFSEDEAGQAVVQALRYAAQRGVIVRLITDGVGTPKFDAAAELTEDGVEHRIYNPRLLSLRMGLTRTHRKLAVIDGRVAFVGGINLIDDHNGGEGHRLPAPRWDFAVRVTGSLVAEVEQAIALQWHRLGDQLSHAKSFLAWLARPVLPGVSLRGRGAVAAFVARDNLHHRHTIEKSYLKAIGHARRSIWLANPYFVPGRRLRRALTSAAERGVQVNLLIGRKEFWLLDNAVPSLYGTFLRAGVRIAEYDKTLLHAKVAVVDGTWATVGSSNCDALSMFLNHEANIVVQNHALVEQLQTHIQQAIEQEAHLIDPQTFANRPLWVRFGNWCAYVTYRWMMKLITVGRYQ